MSNQERWLQNRGQGHIRVALSGYRFMAFAIAIVHLFFLSPVYQSIISPVALVIGVGIYTAAKIIHPLRWQQASILGYGLLGIDIAICIFLVMSTGGFYSPFLLYTLTPVLTAALLLDSKVTFGIAGLSVAYMVGSHAVNPFFTTQLSLPELSYLLVYMIAVVLTTTLPYLTNVNLRQRLQYQDMLRERQRLSREIHDGTAQTLSALRWQAQIVHRRLEEKGIHMNEVGELVRLTEKAYQNSRESLELLRNYIGNGNLLPHLKDYLKHLSQDSGIDFRLDMAADGLHLEALVELELLRICQEALTNVRKHSKGAHHVQVRADSVDNHLKVTITDAGCGFDSVAYYRDRTNVEGHGLAVMQERAESVGGRLRVLSMPGKGTEVQVEVPADSRQGRLPWLK